MLRILRRAEEELGVAHRAVIRIQQQDLGKGGVQQRIAFQFPPAQPSRGMDPPHRRAIHAHDALLREQAAHLIRHLLPAQMPYLDGKPAPQMPQQPHEHIDGRQILLPTAADDDPTPGEPPIRIGKGHLADRLQHRPVPD